MAITVATSNIVWYHGQLVASLSFDELFTNVLSTGICSGLDVHAVGNIVSVDPGTLLIQGSAGTVTKIDVLTFTNSTGLNPTGLGSPDYLTVHYTHSGTISPNFPVFSFKNQSDLIDGDIILAGITYSGDRHTQWGANVSSINYAPRQYANIKVWDRAYNNLRVVSDPNLSVYHSVNYKAGQLITTTGSGSSIEILTIGGYNTGTEIVTALGTRSVAPASETTDLVAYDPSVGTVVYINSTVGGKPNYSASVIPLAEITIPTTWNNTSHVDDWQIKDVRSISTLGAVASQSVVSTVQFVNIPSTKQTVQSILDWIDGNSGGNQGVAFTAKSNIFTVLASSNLQYFDCYSTTLSYSSQLTLRKSNSNTKTVVQTANGGELGSIQVYGVNTSPAFATAGAIKFIQYGSSGAVAVPSNIQFYSGTATGDVLNMILTTSGYLGVGPSITVASIGYMLDVKGNVRISGLNSLCFGGTSIADALVSIHYDTVNVVVGSGVQATLIKTGTIYPTTDSTTGVVFKKVSDSSAVLTIDTTYSHVYGGNRLVASWNGSYGVFLSTGNTGIASLYNIIIGTTDKDTNFHISNASYNIGIGRNTFSPTGLNYFNGSNNISIGSNNFNSILTQITGQYNIGVGTNLFNHLTTGSYNLVMMSTVLNNLTSGSHNILLGYLTGSALTSQSYNIAIGYNSANSMTGNYCVAIGNAVLNKGGSGSNNIGIGTSTLYGAMESPSGSYNIGIGYQTLYNFTTGQHNIALGYQALYNLTTGQYNIALGYQAGFNNTTYNYGINIGYLTQAAGSHEIHIGDGSFYIIGYIGYQLPNSFYLYMGGIYSISSPNTHKALYIDSVGLFCTDGFSSFKYKENIQDMESYSEGIYKLRPVSFNYKKEYSDPSIKRYGFIAEELAEIYPEFVGFKNDKPDTSSILDQFSIMLLNEIQKLKKEIDRIKSC